MAGLINAQKDLNSYMAELKTFAEAGEMDMSFAEEHEQFWNSLKKIASNVMSDPMGNLNCAMKLGGNAMKGLNMVKDAFDEEDEYLY